MLYKIIAAGGKEYGPIDEQKLKTWFQEGRVSNATLVFVPSSSQWDRLENIFNIRQWENPDTPHVIKPSAIEPIYPLSTLPASENTQDYKKPAETDGVANQEEVKKHKQPEPEPVRSRWEWFEFLLAAILASIFAFVLTYSVLVITDGRIVIEAKLAWIIAIPLAALIVTFIRKKRMEKRLGRKLWGDYELTSLNSWMEVEDKDKKTK